MRANPLQAAGFSAVSFAVGAALPLSCVLIYHGRFLIWVIAATALLFLGLLGAIAANAGGANVIRGAARVLFWGSAAMAVTAYVGSLFGTPV
jgi:VIT1/CCC1 family predicted Fe2+/Mn2+ transporter